MQNLYIRKAIGHSIILSTLLDIFFPHVKWTMCFPTYLTRWDAHRPRLLCMQVVSPMAMWSPTYLTRWDEHVGSPHCWGLQGPCVITVTPTLLSLLSVNKMVNGNNHSAEEEPVFLAIPADCHVAYLVHLLFTITRTAAPLSTIMFLHS